jgi:LysR family hydrogen peroxide-inducible transcriptional activator
MEFQQLRYVAALARELHFLKASQKVNVTQPTLSQQIKKLEEELGTPLFERSPRKVRLTAAGQKFLPHALAALAAVERGAGELKQQSGEISGTVKLSVIPTICPYLMPEVITRLHKSAPKLTLELYEDTTSATLSRLREGSVDLGLLSPPTLEKGVSELVLAKEPFYLAVGSRHRLAGRASVSPRELESERLLVLQEGHCFGEQSLDYCKRAVSDTQVIFRGSSLESVLRLAAAGEGVTFVPRMATNTSARPDLRFIPFASPQPERQIGVVWRLSSPLLNTHRFVMDLIAEAAQKKHLLKRSPRGKIGASQS